ncbi:MAG: ABC transporter substrate-binding protein [Bacteroidales bacterium]|nr:ABC transporter substrate-binding protein [Candidatus Liminaster caballi]
MTTAYKYLILLVSAFAVMAGCRQQVPSDPLKPTDASTRYASLLQMQDVDDGVTVCRIMNPWQPERIAIQYLLVADSTSMPNVHELEKRFGQFQVLHTPLERQTVTSSCHVWLLGQLNALNTVGVICDADYVMLPAAQKALNDGEILDGGNAMAPNAEVIGAAMSQCVWVSPYEATSQQIVSAQLPDIPIIYCADYMETDPLARAEWMRFYGRLVGRSAVADSLFETVEAAYLAMTAADSIADHRPSLLPDLPFGATWYVAGGRSTLGQMYRDAGFSYFWQDDTHGGSLALSPEAVFQRAHDADIWLFKHFDESQDESFTLDWLLRQSPLFSEFKAVKTKKVFGCNTAACDYFDSTPFRPDQLLHELKMIAAGNVDSLTYFKPIL